MTLLWLSQRLPVDRPALAAALGNGFELLPSTPLPPAAPAGPDAGSAMTVVTIYEQEIIDELSRRPTGGAIVVVAPPGTDLTGLHTLSPRLIAGIAVSTGDIVNLVHQGARIATTQTGAAPAAAGAVGADVIGTGPGFGAPATGPAAAVTTRRGQLVSASVVLALLIGAAILVVATGGGSAGAATAGGFGGPGGFGGGVSTNQLTALRACLAEQGVSIGNGGLTGTGNAQTALSKCAALMTTGGTTPRGSTGSTGTSRFGRFGGGSGGGGRFSGAGRRAFAGSGTGMGTGARMSAAAATGARGVPPAGRPG
jgi:hypothetical protein